MKARAKHLSAAAPARGLKEVTRYIKPDVERELWGRAAGRCEFSGCNSALWKSSVTQEPVNLAQKAHIYSFSTGGPRGNEGIDRKQLNQFENLMLVCHGCHQKIDKELDGGRYPVTLLRQWKAEHERRIEIVTGIDPSKKSHVLLYGANVGDQSTPLNYAEAAHALFPNRYPADDRPIVLATINSSFRDRDARFWEIESANLENQFNRQVKNRLSVGPDLGGIEHLSVFGIAPQPLLIQLGMHLCDITGAEVFQRHREPQTWDWPTTALELEFRVEVPASFTGVPALVLALTAQVTDARITSVLGDNVSIWRVTVDTPNNDLIKSRAHLSQFRTLIRGLLDRINEHHGQSTTLHIFPVAGVSAAIELGRVKMPKAHIPWQVYDQVNELGGFIPALLLPTGA